MQSLAMVGTVWGMVVTMLSIRRVERDAVAVGVRVALVYENVLMELGMEKVTGNEKRPRLFSEAFPFT